MLSDSWSLCEVGPQKGTPYCWMLGYVECMVPGKDKASVQSLQGGFCWIMQNLSVVVNPKPMEIPETVLSTLF